MVRVLVGWGEFADSVGLRDRTPEEWTLAINAFCMGALVVVEMLEECRMAGGTPEESADIVAEVIEDVKVFRGLSG